MSGLDVSATTSARNWAPITVLPHTFIRLPKAIIIGGAGNLVIVGVDGVSATITPAVGVPIQVRPATIQSATATGIVALFD